MAIASRPPTSELGTEQPFGGAPGGMQQPGQVAPWRTFIDFFEETPELQWPNSIRTFNRMRTDSQVEGLYWGSTLPIMRYKWSIDPNGARDEIVSMFAADVGLPIKGDDAKPIPRMRDRFSFNNHLFHVLLSLLYGHMYFEQVGQIGPDGKWHLRKLSPRMPDTINEIQVAEDGGLVAIRQLAGFYGTPIPVDRLVAYVWGKEGANWAGRSMLRAIFKDWVVKDRLVRIDAIKQDRNGMGVPVATAPPNASRQQIEQLNALAQSFRAGEFAGGAIPNGSTLTLQGTQGTLPDTLSSIKARDEAMARRFLMMFMQLGQTETGSRALGGAFIDWFALAQEAIAGFVVDVFTNHVVEDWVDWNYGEDESLTPRLHFERNEDTQLAAADLVAMINSGAITVDDELEASLRSKYDLPERDPQEAARTKTPKVTPDGEPVATPPSLPQPGTAESEAAAEAQGGGQAASARRTEPRGSKRRSERSGKAASTAPSPLSLPNRKLRRQPYDHEVRAQVDYASLDTTWANATSDIANAWGPVRATQIDALHQQIVDAGGDLKKLTRLKAPAVGSDVLHTHLKAMAEQAANGAVAEALRQGVHIALPDLDKVNGALGTRAAAVDQLLADSLSQAAAARATRLTGGAMEPKDVAQNVYSYLTGLSDSWLKDQLGGAMTAAQNAGRKEVIDSGPASRAYASELLDQNTCGPCTDIDGTEYDNMTDADMDYPTGGYFDCDGGPRCRGTVVAVYQTDADEQAIGGEE